MESLVPAPFQKEHLRMGMVWLGIEWEAQYGELGFGMRPISKSSDCHGLTG